MGQPLALDQAVEALKRDPTNAVRARIGDLTVELRAVSEPARAPDAESSAADVLRGIGRWEGETYEEMVALFSDVRQRSSRHVPDFDLIIACTALEHGATLVTNDGALKDGSIEGLAVEAWLGP